MDLTRRPADKWIVDFGDTMSETDAALYEAPFAHVAEHVNPKAAAEPHREIEGFLVATCEPTSEYVEGAQRPVTLHRHAARRQAPSVRLVRRSDLSRYPRS